MGRSRGLALGLGLAALACATEPPLPEAPPDAGAGAPAPSERRVSRLAMGTLVEVAARDPDPARARAAIEDAFAEIERLEGILSEWRESSDLSRLNRAAGQGWVAVPDELRGVLAEALGAAEASGGAFDPTVLPLVRLWGFAGGEPAIPSDDAIAATRSRVDWRCLEIEHGSSRVRLRRPDCEVGLGGIAKGFIADAAAARLRDRGVRAGLVAAAGDLAFFGGTPAAPWRVSIEDPDRPGSALAELTAVAGGVSTSAATYRFFEAGGRRYHHILDPRTGRPADTGLRQVTIVAPSAARSDAYSTALFVMGPDRAQGFLGSHPELELGAVWILDDGRRIASQGIEVRWTPQAADEDVDP